MILIGILICLIAGAMVGFAAGTLFGLAWARLEEDDQ